MFKQLLGGLMEDSKTLKILIVGSIVEDSDDPCERVYVYTQSLYDDHSIEIARVNQTPEFDEEADIIDTDPGTGEKKSYYLEYYIPSAEVNTMPKDDVCIRFMEKAKAHLENSVLAELKAEYKELDALYHKIQEKRSKNIETQKKLKGIGGKDNGNTGQGTGHNSG